MIYRSLLSLLSPSGDAARLSVLIFHRVLPEPDPLFPDEMHARRFDSVCDWLSEWFNVLPLDAAVHRLKAGTLPSRAACITFDDGYADNFHVALPILQRHGLVATFFVATGYLDGGRMWNDSIIESVRACAMPELDLSSLGLGSHALDSRQAQRAAIASLIDRIKYQPLAERVAVTDRIAMLAGVELPRDLMMTSDEVKNMRQAGMQIGAHTQSHPILAGLSDTHARSEIKASQDFLEGLLGERVSLFAYPNGKPGRDYTPQSVEVVRRLGFDAAVSTQWGVTGQSDDTFQIRRFTPWDLDKFRFGLRMVANLSRGWRPSRSSPQLT